MIFSVKQYDALERAIISGSRIAVRRRGSEYLVVAERLRISNGREVIDARHPSTGHRLELFLDELDGFEIVS